MIVNPSRLSPRLRSRQSRVYQLTRAEGRMRPTRLFVREDARSLAERLRDCFTAALDGHPEIAARLEPGREPGGSRRRQARGRGQERPPGAHAPAGGAAPGSGAGTALFRYRVGDAVTGCDLSRDDVTRQVAGRLKRRYSGGDTVTETALHVVTPLPWPIERRAYR
jgi:hypothetical protein